MQKSNIFVGARIGIKQNVPPEERETAKEKGKKRDIRAIAKYNGDLIGFVSGGDRPEDVKEGLACLVGWATCVRVVICACRTRGGTRDVVIKVAKGEAEGVSHGRFDHLTVFRVGRWDEEGLPPSRYNSLNQKLAGTLLQFTLDIVGKIN